MAVIKLHCIILVGYDCVVAVTCLASCTDCRRSSGNGGIAVKMPICHFWASLIIFKESTEGMLLTRKKCAIGDTGSLKLFLNRS